MRRTRPPVPGMALLIVAAACLAVAGFDHAQDAFGGAEALARTFNLEGS